VRQIVNTEKVIQDQLVAACADQEDEKPEDLKARVSRKLHDIMEKRLSKEFEE